jgi:hypothetical protein
VVPFVCSSAKANVLRTILARQRSGYKSGYRLRFILVNLVLTMQPQDAIPSAAPQPPSSRQRDDLHALFDAVQAHTLSGHERALVRAIGTVRLV